MVRSNRDAGAPKMVVGVRHPIPKISRPKGQLLAHIHDASLGDIWDAQGPDRESLKKPLARQEQPTPRIRSANTRQGRARATVAREPPGCSTTRLASSPSW